MVLAREMPPFYHSIFQDLHTKWVGNPQGKEPPEKLNVIREVIHREFIGYAMDPIACTLKVFHIN